MLNKVTFKEFKSNWEDLKSQVENISKDKFVVLWVSDYYDGPLSGILEFQSQKFRFEIMTDYADEVYPRVFAILNLSESEIGDEVYWNELFKKHVGNHYDLTDTREESIVKPKSEWHLFYDEFNNKPSKTYDLNIVRGWYSEERNLVIK